MAQTHTMVDDDDDRHGTQTKAGNEADEGRHDQNLIGKRVHKLAEVGDKVIFAGNFAIQHIGKGCHRKHQQGDQIVKGKVDQHGCHKKGHQDNAHNGQFIGKIHGEGLLHV